ncbi:MAG: hypothetical protein M3252_04465 [Actinomycetota bacterium]|nr:hypothetical protein [Actinomycetota bacterium]
MTNSGSGIEAGDTGGSRAATGIDEARSHLAKVDELPVAERATVLAAVNELLVAELTAMDEA